MQKHIRRICSLSYVYKTKGTCSREIHIDIEEGKIQDVEFIGGCNGNTKGISSLLKGMDVEEAIKRCKGITCGSRATSCPDQLAIALEKASEN